MTEDSGSTEVPSSEIKGVPPPPGWMEHPSGDVRWWDGTDWTEHRLATESKPPDHGADDSRVQQVEVVSFGELPDTSNLKRWWWWVAALLFPPAGYVVAFLIYQRAGEFLYPVGFVFVSTIALLWWSSVLS